MLTICVNQNASLISQQNMLTIYVNQASSLTSVMAPDEQQNGKFQGC